MSDSSFATIYRRSLNEPEEFWGAAEDEIEWTRPWDAVFDRSAAPAARWFIGGELNTCYNALDRHAEAGRAEQPALIYDSAVLLVLKVGAVGDDDDEVVMDVVASVRERIAPVASFKSAVVVARLPKTRSGKILQGTLARIADDEPWTMPATVVDPVILDEMAVALSTMGYPR